MSNKIFLYHSFVSLQKAFEKFFNQVSKDHTFQYVSILRTIEVILLKEDVQKYVLSSGETENDELICEFKDGLIYKNNHLWTSSVKPIKIMLYCDELVCAKPLGNKIKK